MVTGLGRHSCGEPTISLMSLMTKLETQQRVPSRSTYCVSTEVIQFLDEVGYIMKFNSAYLISLKGFGQHIALNKCKPSVRNIINKNLQKVQEANMSIFVGSLINCYQVFYFNQASLILSTFLYT